MADRKEMEQAILPSRFYDDCVGLMSELEEREAEYLAVLYNRFFETDIWEAGDFDAALLDYETSVSKGRDIRLYRIVLPKDMSAEIIYLLYDDGFSPISYITVERSEEENSGIVRRHMFAIDEKLSRSPYGEFDIRGERASIDRAVELALAGGRGEDERISDMRRLLTEKDIRYFEDEIGDYIQMFDVMDELTEQRLTMEERVAAFAGLSVIMADESFITGRDKMRAMFYSLEDIQETRGKLDRKSKLFLAFSVYAACSLISENNDKRHYYMGIGEFESAEYLKFKMEEYWGFDPYMFTFE